jgi:hypothetical protein
METKIENLGVAFDRWPAFLTRSRKEFYFIEYEAPDMLRVNRRMSKEGENHEYFYNMNVMDVDIDNLKFIGVWDKLSKELQERLVKGDEEGAINAKNRMEHARKHRRGKYQNVPKQVVCCNCGKEQKMAAGLIVKNAEKWAEKNKLIPDTEAWIKQWKCQKCSPTPKGRKPSHNLPPNIELICVKKCGKKIVYPAAMVAKTIAKKGITLEQYVNNFVCQSCCNTRGRKKKSK